MSVQEHSFANPGGAGLAALAVACFGFGAMFLGFVSHDALPILACWLFGGFVVQIVCAVIELKDHNPSGGNVFLFFSAFFMLVAAISCATKYGLHQAGLPFDTRIEGWGWLAGAIFLTLATPAYLKSTKLLFIAFIFIDVALWGIVAMDLKIGNPHIFAPIVGWILIGVGFVGAYLSGAITTNLTLGKSVLPIPGPFIK